MINFFRYSALLLSLFLCGAVHAQDIHIHSAWARETLPGQDTGMVSLSLTSKHAATLTAVSSPACKTVEMHQMSHDNNMMKMREVNSIALSAGVEINFAESGYHLMLVGLKQPLQAGGKIPLTLIIKTADKRVSKVKASAEVKPFAAQANDGEAAHTHQHAQ